MTGLQVVQRVLDFWDPLGASVYSGGSVNQIDEYDRYARAAHEMLLNGAVEGDLRTYLDTVRFKTIGLSRSERAAAENRFYAWALAQTWTLQQREDSNVRIREDGQLGPITELDLVQQFLQDWDPLDLADIWLCGSDVLQSYDEAAVHLVEALRADVSLEDMAQALALIAMPEPVKIAFHLENRKLSTEAKQEKFLVRVSELARSKTGLANNLIVAFRTFPNKARYMQLKR